MPNEIEAKETEDHEKKQNKTKPFGCLGDYWWLLGAENRE